MGKCKVVDMSTMSPEEQKAAMEKHAGSGGAPAALPEATPEATPAARATEDASKSFTGMGKGFLKGKTVPLYGEGGSPEGTTKPSTHADALFDSLVAGGSLPAPTALRAYLTAVDSLLVRRSGPRLCRGGKAIRRRERRGA